MIDALLKTGYHIIIRPHPQSYTSEKQMLDELMNRYPESENLEWNSSNDNFDVLRRSDILISDYSGVIFDYSLVFDKPIIYADTSFDKGPYDAWWLDDEMWTFTVLPKLGRQLTTDNFESVGELIDNCLNARDLKEGRAEARSLLRLARLSWISSRSTSSAGASSYSSSGTFQSCESFDIIPAIAIDPPVLYRYARSPNSFEPTRTIVAPQRIAS